MLKREIAESSYQGACMKYILLFLLSSCAIQSRYGVYERTICTENRWGELECDNGQEYYRAIDAVSVYDK